MRKKRTYRSKVRILVDMMRTIQGESEEGAGPTKILYAANLSHNRLTQYLDELLEKELISSIENNDNSRVYFLTEKGREFLREFAKVERFSEAFGIEV
jgi:predicted transcriptional regulator